MKHVGLSGRARALRGSRGWSRRTTVMAAVAIGFVVVMALPASACHPVLSGQTTCNEDQQVVTWSIGNSESGATLSMHILTVTAKLGSTPVGVAGWAPIVAPSGVTHAISTFSGSQTGTVVLTVTATWPAAHITTTKTTSVDLVTNCHGTTTTTTVAPTTTTTVAPTTTTTEAPTTTTTEAPTTTTTEVATTTTTEAGPTTTTTEAGPTTTTTEAGPTTTTTEAGPTTTVVGPTTSTSVSIEGTTVAGKTTTTAAAPSTTGAPVTAAGTPSPTGGLPFTGGSEWPQAIFGFGSLGLGAALWVVSRRRRSTTA